MKRYWQGTMLAGAGRRVSDEEGDRNFPLLEDGDRTVPAPVDGFLELVTGPRFSRQLWQRLLAVVLLVQPLLQALSDGAVVGVSKLAPIREAVFVADDPLDGLLLEQAIVFAGVFLDDPQVDDRFMPRLSQDGNSQVSFGPEIYLLTRLGVSTDAPHPHGQRS